MKPKTRSVLLGLAETGEYAVVSGGLGLLYGRFRERAKLLGVPVDLLVGLVGTAVATGADLFLGSPYAAPSWTRWLRTAGNAGLGAVSHKVGTGLGLAWSGRKVVSLPASAALPPGATRMHGDLPSAPVGDVLRQKDLDALSRV